MRTGGGRVHCAGMVGGVVEDKMRGNMKIGGMRDRSG